MLLNSDDGRDGGRWIEGLCECVCVCVRGRVGGSVGGDDGEGWSERGNRMWGKEKCTKRNC